jgi:cytidylate kinase
MAVITISRQYGSGGRKIATRVAELLNYQFFDKHLMAQIAPNVGMSDNEIVDYSEESYHPQSFMQQIRNLLGQPESVAEISTLERDSDGRDIKVQRKLDESQAMEMVRETVRTAAKQGNVVIIGRGAQVILRDMEDAFHIRVIAPMQTRMDRLEMYEHLSYNQAWGLALDRDKANLEYMQRFFDEHPDNPLLYDMIINTGKFSVDDAAQLIVEAVKKSQRNIDKANA